MARHDPAPRRALAGLVALILFVAAAAGGIMWLLHPTAGTRITDADARVRGSATRPALQSAPQSDLARYRAEKQRELDATGPLPDAPGYARIPLAQAIDLIARRGLRASRAGVDGERKGSP